MVGGPLPARSGIDESKMVVVYRSSQVYPRLIVSIAPIIPGRTLTYEIQGENPQEDGYVTCLEVFQQHKKRKLEDLPPGWQDSF